MLNIILIIMSKVKSICKECGIEFLARSYQLKIGTGKYCSRYCSSKNQKVEILEIRFWKMVNKKSKNDCWEFTGCKNKDGYGRMSKGNSKLDSAHRISYELHKGVIPTNMVVMHTCDNPPCCNPNHLKLGTQSDNILDMVIKRRNVPRKSGKEGSKFSNEQIIKIRESYTGIKGQKFQLSKIHNCSPSTITNILNNWK